MIHFGAIVWISFHRHPRHVRVKVAVKSDTGQIRKIDIGQVIENHPLGAARDRDHVIEVEGHVIDDPDHVTDIDDEDHLISDQLIVMCRVRVVQKGFLKFIF